MKKPIIFLDFDGMLNTEQYQARLAVAIAVVKDSWGPLFDLLTQNVQLNEAISQGLDSGISEDFEPQSFLHTQKARCNT